MNKRNIFVVLLPSTYVLYVDHQGKGKESARLSDDWCSTEMEHFSCFFFGYKSNLYGFKKTSSHPDPSTAAKAEQEAPKKHISTKHLCSIQNKKHNNVKGENYKRECTRIHRILAHHSELYCSTDSLHFARTHCLCNQHFGELCKRKQWRRR